MDHDAGIAVALGVAVAGDMGTAVDDAAVMPGLGQLARDHRARQTRTDQKYPHPVYPVPRGCRGRLPELGPL